MRYEEIGEIEKGSDVAAINRKLKEGWVLIGYERESEKISTERGEALKEAVVFIIGRRREEEQGQQGKDPWRKNEDGSEWASASDVPGLAEKLKGGPFAEGGYVYWISKNGRYVHRRPAEKGDKR